MIKIKTALLSTYYKEGLEVLAAELKKQEVDLISTGGTLDFLKTLGLSVTPVESLTQFPEMLGGRVKTLHPKVFGGILNRRQVAEDQAQIAEFDIPSIDLVVVNLYPFQETLKKGGNLEELIEKIDIGGVSLIRAAAKNFQDVCIVAHPEDYASIAGELKENQGFISLETRKKLAAKAFQITSAYDLAISTYLKGEQKASDIEFGTSLSLEESPKMALRYGENPHQEAAFYGRLDTIFRQVHGKELSFNNLVDAEAALELISDLGENKPAAVIIKHTNACGVARARLLKEAYEKALACDPLSAFGGVIALNKKVELDTALILNELFFEILLAPEFSFEALEILKSKKNRILLEWRGKLPEKLQIKSLLGGLLVQEKDLLNSVESDLKTVTDTNPSKEDLSNLLFANILAKHTKSNTIVLTKNDVLLASGTGQTSRVDALKQAIQKAKSFGFDLHGAAMASDAFFPFSDCVEIAAAEGISAVIQPGGSIRDQDSIDACNRLKISMVTTGVRHFKH
jgi:phosphoribosylaminoimidazolecarboxamide formyltransferase/IMP cyclohydrolase